MTYSGYRFFDYELRNDLAGFRTVMKTLLKSAHAEWHDILERAMKQMDQQYLQALTRNEEWLPGINQLFNAFNIPLSSTRYILMGESPYPRVASANGYAFWDAAVDSLWSETGLSKEVNRATSLRNFMKMLLRARGDLREDVSQPAIANLDKSQYIQTCSALFQACLNHGFLLLNASLVFTEGKVAYHAKQWRPFMHDLFTQLVDIRPTIQLLLFGRIANQLPETLLFPNLVSEHPYNISFITNLNVIEFFKPFDLLTNDEQKHNH